MRNNFIIICCLCLSLPVFLSCEKKDDIENTALFEIDCENSSIAGSFVQNTLLTAVNTFNLIYLGGENTSATVSAKEINGIRINETTVDLSSSGLIKLPITGKPIDLGEYTLKIEVTIHGKKYYCGQVFEVEEDLNPDAPITFNLDSHDDNLFGLIEPSEIPYTVDPATAAITVQTPVTGLNVKYKTDKQTGDGVLTLTPSDEFIGGSLVLLISYGARQPITHTLNVSAFNNGDGVSTPYEISSPALLQKIHYLPDKKFILTADIDLSTINWSPVGSIASPFTGSLNGNGKRIYNISLTGKEHVALFAHTGTDASISNLTIQGSVTGTEYVAGLVANNAGKITACNAAGMMISGENYLSGLAAKNTGVISSSSPTDILSFTNFPAMISEIKTTINKSLGFSPASATATIVKNPEKASASISGGTITITPEAGFVKSDLSIRVSLGNVSSIDKVIALFAEEQFDNGDGSPSNPYIISKVSQLNKIRDYNDKQFRLAADLDLSTLEAQWVPIPTFSGMIDGQNHKITNFKLDPASKKGGFIEVNSGTVKNLYFQQIDIKTAVAFGVIVGEHTTGGLIENVVVTGTIVSTNSGDLLGGIACEQLGGKISNVYVNLNMTTGCGMTGAIAGRSRGTAGEISNCTSEGTITVTAGKTRIAGIVGRGETGVIIKNCLSTMTINATVTGANGVGGIFGANNNNDMRIDECMFKGSISNVFMCGGIAGVAANLRNCVIEGKGTTLGTPTISVGGTVNTSSAGGICGTGKIIIEKCIVRDAVLTGVSTAALPIAGISSTFQNNGYVARSVVDNVLINATNLHGVTGTVGDGTSVNADNYISGVQFFEAGAASAYVPVNNKNGLDGESVAGASLNQAFYQALGFDFTSVWKWENNKPVLQNVGYKGSIIIQ